MSAQPDSPGIWAFEGYINYARHADPNRIETMVVRVFWGTVSRGWHTVDDRGGYNVDKCGGGRRPAHMLIGTWSKFTP